MRSRFEENSRPTVSQFIDLKQSNYSGSSHNPEKGLFSSKDRSLFGGNERRVFGDMPLKRSEVLDELNLERVKSLSGLGRSEVF